MHGIKIISEKLKQSLEPIKTQCLSFFITHSGSYIHPEVEENFSAVKLIAINPNELDEEDAFPTTPMLNQRDADSTDNPAAAANGVQVGGSGG